MKIIPVKIIIILSLISILIFPICFYLIGFLVFYLLTLGNSVVPFYFICVPMGFGILFEFLALITPGFFKLIIKNGVINNYIMDGTKNDGWCESISNIRKIELVGKEEVKKYFKQFNKSKAILIDFGNYNVCVPVSYELDGNKISVSINSDEITEAEYKIYQISVLPYMVSAKNNDSKDSYIFVPYGSGAIMYTDNTLRAPRSFNAEMYGDDLTINKEEQFNTDEALKLPVFAAQNVDNAMFAIIESGAEYASLSARAGDIDTGYSNVYPLFKLRGYNTTLIDDVSSEGKYIMRISDERVSDVYKVSYYFMDNAEASISSMAELYRNYINSVYGERNVASQKPYYLKILGGSFVDDYFLGIP
ncbi:MAG: hypothetical protein IJF72_04115, partial [Clostridia bacterium]|nr:hypothetical protein [Clostridia bacterium]